MLDRSEVLGKLKALISDYKKLSLDYRKEAAEKKAEEYILDLFEVLGWQRRGEEVIPQKRVKRAGTTEHVDYSFKLAGSLKPSIYVEVKKFSKSLDDPADVKQAIDYGKNGGARWTVLTNFAKIRIFNSDFYDDIPNAELFTEIDVVDGLDDPMVLDHLLLLSRDACVEGKLDHYAKVNKKWKESADIEVLLTETLLEMRKKLSKAFYEQNTPLFEMMNGKDGKIDECVQLLFDRLIFCRIAEDNGVDESHKLWREYEKWEPDKRVQFYSEFLVPYFARMNKIYDSTIFETHKIDNLRVKNEDFTDAFLAFYNAPGGLRYRFDAIPSDVLGHVYENYLSFKASKTPTKVSIREELFKRKQSGIYYTPEFLVDHLVKTTIGRKLAKCKTASEALSIKVLDPACGSGTFLIRAYDEFRKWFEAHPEASQTHLSHEEAGISSFLDSVLENCIYGIDLDPRAVELTRLNLFIRALHNPKKLPRMHIIHANSLVSDPDDEACFTFQRDFPLAFESGGFDVILTNPPWEKWKPDSQEFFEPHDPGFKSLPAQKAKARMQELFHTRPYLKKQWVEYNAKYEALSEVFRDERNYQFQSAEAEGRMVSGDLDLYKLFTERVHQLLKPEGLAGIVIPSGVYTDLGAKGLRTMLFDHSVLEYLYCFENRKGLFPDVHRSYKFCLVSFKKGGKTKSFPAAFFLYGKEDLENALRNPFHIETAFVKESSPTAWGVIELQSPLDYEIIKNKLLTHPRLGEDVKNAWNISITRGFDMTNDSQLFQPYGKGIPLLEGKNIHQFTHRWEEEPTPRYSISESDVAANLKPEKRFDTEYWLAYRLLASSTNERTLIATVIPPGYVCGHSIAIVRTSGFKELCFLAGVVNSFVLDYLMRKKTSTNITMFNFLELPVPRLSSGPVFDAIVKKVAQLTCTTKEFSKLKEEAGIEFAVVDEADRKVIKAQIDALVAKLYGLTRPELEHILTKFPLVADDVKQQVLHEYDKL